MPHKDPAVRRAYARERNRRPDVKAKHKAWKHAHPERVQHYNLKRYGISVPEYDAMFAVQNGLCAICGAPPGRLRLHVDHDHTTGRVRGLLCSECNTGLPIVEAERRLAAARLYLARP